MRLVLPESSPWDCLHSDWVEACQKKGKKIGWLIVMIVYSVLSMSIAHAETSSSTDHYALLQEVEQQRQAMLQQNAPTATDPTPDHSSTNTADDRGSDPNIPANTQPTPVKTTTSSTVTLTPEQQLKAARRESTFESILEQTLPMTPSQIERLRRMYDKTQEAASKPAKIPPLPTSTSQVVDLSPGAVPPVIRLSEGFVSSLVFVDSTGAAWPITAYDLGNPKAFNIQWDKYNTLMIQAMSPYTYGNLAVKLQDQTTPVMLTLIPGQRIVDYRVDLRISGLGPNAKLTPAQLAWVSPS